MGFQGGRAVIRAVGAVCNMATMDNNGPDAISSFSFAVDARPVTRTRTASTKPRNQKLG